MMTSTGWHHSVDNLTGLAAPPAGRWQWWTGWWGWSHQWWGWTLYPETGAVWPDRQKTDRLVTYLLTGHRFRVVFDQLSQYCLYESFCLNVIVCFQPLKLWRKRGEWGWMLWRLLRVQRSGSQGVTAGGHEGSQPEVMWFRGLPASPARPGQCRSAFRCPGWSSCLWSAVSRSGPASASFPPSGGPPASGTAAPAPAPSSAAAAPPPGEGRRRTHRGVRRSQEESGVS